MEEQYHITQIKPTKGSRRTSIKRITTSQNVLSTISTHGKIYEKREFISTLIVIYILLILNCTKNISKDRSYQNYEFSINFNNCTKNVKKSVL